MTDLLQDSTNDQSNLAKAAFDLWGNQDPVEYNVPWALKVSPKRDLDRAVAFAGCKRVYSLTDTPRHGIISRSGPRNIITRYGVKSTIREVKTAGDKGT